MTILGDIIKTTDGKIDLKRWSFDDGKHWVYPYDIDDIKPKDARGGEGNIPRLMGYVKGKDARFEYKRYKEG